MLTCGARTVWTILQWLFVHSAVAGYVICKYKISLDLIVLQRIFCLVSQDMYCDICL